MASEVKNRPAIDIVIIGMTATIAGLLLLTSLAVILIELIHPSSDTSDLIRMESEILGVLVGALVGFIGGRSLGRAEPREDPPVQQ